MRHIGGRWVKGSCRAKVDAAMLMGEGMVLIPHKERRTAYLTDEDGEVVARYDSESIVMRSMVSKSGKLWLIQTAENVSRDEDDRAIILIRLSGDPAAWFYYFPAWKYVQKIFLEEEKGRVRIDVGTEIVDLPLPDFTK